MGLTEVTVRVHGPLEVKEHRLLVDTWIDGEVLKEIGVETIGTQRFKTIDKRIIERPVADVLIEYEAPPRYCPVAFAEKGDANVLGAIAMEIIGLEIDPTTHELRRITAHAARASPT